MQSVFYMVSWQLSNKVSTVQCQITVSQAQVYKSLRWHVFLKAATDQVLVLIHCGLRFKLVSLSKKLCLVTSIVKKKEKIKQRNVSKQSFPKLCTICVLNGQLAAIKKGIQCHITVLQAQAYNSLRWVGTWCKHHIVVPR